MQSIGSLVTKLSDYLAAPQINQIKRAYLYAEQAHDGQLRRTGEPYINHPLAVADILADMHMDSQSLTAAILHDVIEDTGITKKALADQFGEPVAELVDGVSKLTQIDFATRAEAEAENFQKMAMAMAKDIRVILVKLADRLHNMRTLDVLSPEKRRRIARETLEIYAPIALRLGMNTVRVEFEDRSFAILHPMRAERIQAAVKGATGNRKELLEQIKKKIEVCLQQSQHDARVIGREKHLYSIYRKMREKRKSFSEIMDVLAFRIIVKNVDSCYRTLGIIHNLYKPVPGHFKDYIAIPKANGYQSLHTVLFGMHGVPIEIQIRTEEMEEMANKGIAAHWLYKAQDEDEQEALGSHARARQWVQGLLEMQENAGSSLEFIENVKIDLFPDEIYVFTPKGDILELPNGATAVDFAYAVHTDVGNTCVACRINRRLAPLSEPLKSGQTIEVITTPGAQPNPAWLNFVISGKARSNIRHYLKNQRLTESTVLGRRLLDKGLAAFGTSVDKLSAQQIEHVLAESGRPSFEAVLEDIGLGNKVAYIVARQLVGNLNIETPTGLSTTDTIRPQKPLMIRGTEGLIVNFGKCCYPIPGDPIVGYISAGRGMVVHNENCNNIAEIRHNTDKCVQLYWADHVKGEFIVELKVELESHRGIIATLANKISSLDVSIEKISIEEKDAQFSVLHLLLAVTSRVHLARIMRRIKTINSVLKVSRVKH